MDGDRAQKFVCVKKRQTGTGLYVIEMDRRDNLCGGIDLGTAGHRKGPSLQCVAFCRVFSPREQTPMLQKRPLPADASVVASSLCLGAGQGGVLSQRALKGGSVKWPLRWAFLGNVNHQRLQRSTGR